jgi:ketopantoate reductase
MRPPLAGGQDARLFMQLRPARWRGLVRRPVTMGMTGSRPRLCVLGSGAVATAMSVMLSEAGFEIECVQPGRKDHVCSMRLQKGHSISEARVSCHGDPGGIDPGSILLCLLACKWRDAAHMLALCRSAWGRETPLVLMLQNGIVQDEIPAGGDDRQIPVVVYASMERVEHGAARAHSIAQFVTAQRIQEKIGCGPGALLGEAGFRFVSPDELCVSQLNKLVLATTGAAMALRNLTIGEALESYYRHEMAAVARESSRIALQTLGCATVAADLAEKCRTLAQLLDEGTVPGADREQLSRARTSLHLDLARGVACEIHQINGWIVRQAHAAGQRAPLNECLLAEIQGLEQLRITPAEALANAGLQERVTAAFAAYARGARCE